MDSLAKDYQALFAGDYTPPCISIYLPTHRNSPERLQDPIRFRNLIRQAESELREKYPNADADALLAPFREAAEDKEIWNNTLDGLAILGSEGKLHTYPLRVEVEEVAWVGERFYTRPLIGILESGGCYHVLALDLQNMRLFEGDAHSIHELKLDPSAPTTIDGALGDQLTEPYRTYSSNARGTSSTYHGGGSRQDEVDDDTEKFFRIVDYWVAEHYSHPLGFPLILAALTEHHALFRDVSKNPLLELEGIEADPFALSPDEMRKRAQRVLEGRRLRLEDEMISRFEAAYGQEDASADVAEIARAAAEGRVAILLMESDKQIGGTLDKEMGTVEYSDRADAPDLLDQLAEAVLRDNGEIMILPAERMPVASGVAGIFRF